MYQIQQITTDATQVMNLLLPDGTSIAITLQFKPMMFGWFLSLTYNGFPINNLRISNSPNMLRQWKNVLPFGIACSSVALREPSQQQDFSSGASTLFVLTPSEVEQFEEFINGN